MSSPERVYVDLQHTKNALNFPDKGVTLSELAVSKIRVAERQPGLTRMVLFHVNPTRNPAAEHRATTEQCFFFRAILDVVPRIITKLFGVKRLPPFFRKFAQQTDSHIAAVKPAQVAREKPSIGPDMPAQCKSVDRGDVFLIPAVVRSSP